MDVTNLKFDANGLIPAVIQDMDTNQVLMVGYMDLSALMKTLESGLITFWSRSRKRLWTKGETSGNFLSLTEIRVDCDQDALLFKVQPAGPTCHTGHSSCFFTKITPTKK